MLCDKPFVDQSGQQAMNGWMGEPNRHGELGESSPAAVVLRQRAKQEDRTLQRSYRR
jgi:hypothetical protein